MPWRARFGKASPSAVCCRANPDGGVTVWLGPEPPAGHEGNWVQTMLGKGYSVILRLYGPLEPWFDQTWRPGDIEKVR